VRWRGDMRAPLLVLTLTMASLEVSVGARAELNCFQTPGEGVRGACIGTTDCSEMKNSGRCKSDAECDKGELGAVICSCKAARISSFPRSLRFLLRPAEDSYRL